MAINLISLLNGGQQQAVRDSYAETFSRDVSDAQRATGVASLRTGMNPAAAARQYSVNRETAMAQRADSRRAALAQAKVADDGQLSALMGLGINEAAGIGERIRQGLMGQEDEQGSPASSVASGAGTALGTAIGGPIGGAVGGGVGSALGKALLPSQPVYPTGQLPPQELGFLPQQEPETPPFLFAQGLPQPAQALPGVQTGPSPSPAPQAPQQAVPARQQAFQQQAPDAFAALGQLSVPDPTGAPIPGQPQSQLAQAIAPRILPAHIGTVSETQRRIDALAAANAPAIAEDPVTPDNLAQMSPGIQAANRAFAEPPPSQIASLAGPSAQERAAAQQREAFNRRMARPAYMPQQGPLTPEAAQADEWMMGLYRGR